MGKAGWTTQQLPSGQEVLCTPSLDLTVIKGPNRGLKAQTSGLEVCVGSARSCDLTLTDPTVSRNHFLLEALANGIRLRDLGSTNGTYIKGVRVMEALIPAGTEISIGATVV